MKLRKLLVLLLVFQLGVGPTWALEIGGSLFVDLNAADFDPAGDVWKNNSNGYTDFTKIGDPTVAMVGSHQAVLLSLEDNDSDGADDAFVGADYTPESIVYGEQRTIEAWVYNPSIAGEETIVSWGKRGGGDGTNMSFNYGSNGAFGAVGHWGAPDLGWNDNGGAPDPFAWHHLVYTYDLDGITKVYADGQLANEENTAELIGGLDTHDDTAIAIGAQWLADASDDTLGDPSVLEPGLRGTMGIGRLRVHDQALTAVQIAANYNEEKPFFVDPEIDIPEVRDPIARPLSASPIHRYSFSNAAGDATDGELIDSIGGANGVVLGDFAEFTGTSLRLPGGSSAEAAYGDLPNGLISGLTDVTIEAWATTEGVQNWGRIFDFGSNSPGGEDGELFGPGEDNDTPENGGTNEGLDYLALTAARGTNTNDHRVEIRDEDPAGGGVSTIDFTVVEELPAEVHYTVVYDSDGAETRDFLGNVTGVSPSIEVYYNGELVAEGATDIELSDINDVNNWLGRSNWTADANFEGTFDEFRIYDYALDQDEVLGSYESGADVLDILETMMGDCNMDGSLTTDDLACIVSAEGADGLAALLDTLNVIPGDLDADNEVGFSDFLILSGNFGNADAGYTGGDIDGDGQVAFADFLTLSGNFGQSNAAGSSVPEPSSHVLFSIMLGLALAAVRRRRK